MAPPDLCSFLGRATDMGCAKLARRFIPFLRPGSCAPSSHVASPWGHLVPLPRLK